MAKVRAIGLASVTALLVAMFAQVAVSSTSSPNAQSVTRGGTLVAARAADGVRWDPAHINENDSLWAAFQTNGNLIMTTPDGKGFQPYIAKNWKTSNGGKVFTFQIDPNAKFCDGSAITANDVVFSFQRASAPKAIVSWQYPKGMKIAAKGAHTVVITLPTANASFLSYLTLWGTGIVSQAYAKKVGDKGLASKPLGSGPFCLANWQRGVEIDLTRNQAAVPRRRQVEDHQGRHRPRRRPPLRRSAGHHTRPAGPGQPAEVGVGHHGRRVPTARDDLALHELHEPGAEGREGAAGAELRNRQGRHHPRGALRSRQAGAEPALPRELHERELRLSV